MPKGSQILWRKLKKMSRKHWKLHAMQWRIQTLCLHGERVSGIGYPPFLHLPLLSLPPSFLFFPFSFFSRSPVSFHSPLLLLFLPLPQFKHFPCCEAAWEVIDGFNSVVRKNHQLRQSSKECHRRSHSIVCSWNVRCTISHFCCSSTASRHCVRPLVRHCIFTLLTRPAWLNGGRGVGSERMRMRGETPGSI